MASEGLTLVPRTGRVCITGGEQRVHSWPEARLLQGLRAGTVPDESREQGVDGLPKSIYHPPPLHKGTWKLQRKGDRWSVSPRIVWALTLTFPPRQGKAWGSLRIQAGRRTEGAGLCQPSQQRSGWLKMCAQDTILVNLQIMFKANIYKED